MFGSVTSIYVVKEIVMFALHILHTYSFDPHYHAYRVQNATSSEFVDCNSLLSHDPLCNHLVRGHTLFSLKYRLLSK